MPRNWNTIVYSINSTYNVHKTIFRCISICLYTYLHILYIIYIYIYIHIIHITLYACVCIYIVDIHVATFLLGAPAVPPFR